MNVRVYAAGGGNAPLAGNDLGPRADRHVDAGLDVGVARLANSADAAGFDADVGLDDPGDVHDQRVGDHGVGDACVGALALSHAVADHFASAERDLLAVNRVVALDLDHQIGVAQTYPIACGGAVHLRIGAAIDDLHGVPSLTVAWLGIARAGRCGVERPHDLPAEACTTRAPPYATRSTVLV